MTDIPLINANETANQIIGALPPALIDKLSPLITIFKAVGIVVLIYIIFLIIKTFLAIRDHARIKKTHNLTKEINEKLDTLIKQKSKKTKKKR